MKKLYICGYGISEDDISLKTIKALQSSDLIISPSIDRNSFLFNFISNLNKKTKIENIRDIPPNRVVSKIIKAAKNYKTISVLFYGNPLFMNLITEKIIKKIKNIKIVTLPAVSSFDMIFHIMPELNIFSEKITFISNRMIEKAVSDKNYTISLDNLSHVFIFGAENIKIKNKVNIFFTELFLTHYSKKHPIYLIHVKDLSKNENIVKKTTIYKLKDELDINTMYMLYIPPKKDRK